MSFRVERILTNGEPDIFFPRKNKDATPGDTVSAFDPNQLAEAVVDTQTLLLSTIEDVVVLQASLGQTTLQDVYDNSAAAGQATMVVQPGKPFEIANALKVDSNQTVTATGTLFVNFASQMLKLIYNEMSTSVTDLLVKAGGVNDLILESTKDLLLKDSNLQVVFSDASNSSLDTTAQTLIGAINELYNTTVAANLQSAYNISPNIITGAGGSISLSNGTGNPLTPILITDGIIHSEKLATSELSVGSNAVLDNGGNLITIGDVTASKIFSQELNAGASPLLLVDVFTSVGLTDNQNTSLDTANKTIMGGINEIKALVDSAGSGTLDLYLSHAIGGLHNYVNINVPLGSESSTYIDIKNDSAVTQFSADGNGLVKLNELETISGTDLLQQITDAFNHITDSGIGHADVFNHINASNPHDSVGSLQVFGNPTILKGDVKLEFAPEFDIVVDGPSKKITIDSPHFAAANPHGVVADLGIVGDAGIAIGPAKLNLGPGLSGSVNPGQNEINLDVSDEFGPILVLEDGDDFPSSTVTGSVLVKGQVNLLNHGVVEGNIHFESGSAKIVGNYGMTIYGNLIGIINGANAIETSGILSGEDGKNVILYGNSENVSIITKGATGVATGGNGGSIEIGSIHGAYMNTEGGHATVDTGGNGGSVFINSHSSLLSLDTDGGNGNGTSDGGDGGSIDCKGNLVASLIRLNGGSSIGASGTGGNGGAFNCYGHLTVTGDAIYKGGASAGGTGGNGGSFNVHNGAHIKRIETLGYQGNSSTILSGFCIIKTIITGANYNLIQAGSDTETSLYIGDWTGHKQLATALDAKDMPGNIPGTPTSADIFDLTQSRVIGDQYLVDANNLPIPASYLTLSPGTGPAGVDQVIIDSISAGLTGGEAIDVTYAYSTSALSSFETKHFRYSKTLGQWRVFNDGGAA